MPAVSGMNNRFHDEGENELLDAPLRRCRFLHVMACYSRDGLLLVSSDNTGLVALPVTIFYRSSLIKLFLTLTNAYL